MSAADGGSAFPHGLLEVAGGGLSRETERGMSLRDYFASKAMNGMLAYPGVAISGSKFQEYAAASYAMADALLAARSAT